MTSSLKMGNDGRSSIHEAYVVIVIKNWGTACYFWVGLARSLHSSLRKRVQIQLGHKISVTRKED